MLKNQNMWVGDRWASADGGKNVSENVSENERWRAEAWKITEDAARSWVRNFVPNKEADVSDARTWERGEGGKYTVAHAAYMRG